MSTCVVVADYCVARAFIATSSLRRVTFVLQCTLSLADTAAPSTIKSIGYVRDTFFAKRNRLRGNGP